MIWFIILEDELESNKDWSEETCQEAVDRGVYAKVMVVQTRMLAVQIERCE